MKRSYQFQRIASCFLFIFLFTITPTILAAESSAKENFYLIGPEDVLEISVWKDLDLTRQVVVKPDGNISFPLIGEVKAGGHSTLWLQEHIAKRVYEYVPDAVVTVMVIQVNSMKIYIIGKVMRPGEYKIGKNINIMQALALAGGLNTFADEDNILILRDDKGDQIQISFNYNKVKKGKSVEQNILLQAGDVVVVR